MCRGKGIYLEEGFLSSKEKRREEGEEKVSMMRPWDVKGEKMIQDEEERESLNLRVEINSLNWNHFKLGF